MTSDKNTKRSRRLLGVYWLYKVLNGGNVLKATIDTLLIEVNASKKQYADRHQSRDNAQEPAAPAKAEKRTSGGSKKTGKSRSAAGARLFKAVLNKARVI